MATVGAPAKPIPWWKEPTKDLVSAPATTANRQRRRISSKWKAHLALLPGIVEILEVV